MSYKPVIERKLSFRLPAGFLLTCLILLTVFPLEKTFGADNKSNSSSCSAITELATGSFLVEKAEIVPEGPAPGPGGKANILPEHCLVQGMINPRTSAKGQKFGIGFELRMPANWNNRFFFQGGAGLDGMLSSAIGSQMGSDRPSALAQGFAVVSTDGGHRSSMLDGTFGLDQQARIDYGYNALDKVTLKAKELIEKYYGAAPTYSYFIGCSNGGRQALMASQRFPLYFDGIVAGDPAIKFSGIAMDEIWNVQVAARIAPKDENGRPIISKAFSNEDLNLVADTLLKRCDALDGLADGFINDWQGCDFDPGILTCKSEKTGTCLSKAQVDALRDMFNGPHTSDGKSIYGPFTYDTGVAGPEWRSMHIGSSGTGKWDSADATLGLVNLSYLQLTPPDPDLDPLEFDFDRDAVKTRHTAANTDADSTFLSTFADHGKMIVYNGLSDQGMASGVLSAWYDEVVEVNGPSIRDSVRLFFIPGMCHCSGGKSTDQFNTLDAIMDWVEKGTAPDRIIATGRSYPGVTRPLCPYPLVARYKNGDINSADSFVCSE